MAGQVSCQCNARQQRYKKEGGPMSKWYISFIAWEGLAVLVFA
jgi:hypothetical protein